MALNFPNSPTNGQVYLDVSTGNRWAWDAANTCWKSTSVFTQAITVAASAPGEPVVGQLWWNQEYGRLLVYYNDGTSSQWVDASPSDYTSTQAFNQSNNSYALANASFNMANGSYTTANAAFVDASTANTNVGKAYNTANAAFAKANNALANTSGTVFGGSLLVSSNVRTNTIQSYDGTNYIVDGYPRMPGQIIQVVNTYYTTQTSQSFSGTYGVYTDISGLAATITPRSASSKIYILVRWFGEYGASGATWNSMWSVKRNGTAIGQPTPNGSGSYGLMMTSLSYYADNASSTPEMVSFDYYDSPATTSALTYQVTVMSTSGGTIYTNRCVSNDEVGTSSITLFEIS